MNELKGSKTGVGVKVGVGVCDGNSKSNIVLAHSII
jgi:hypothetical protein